MEGGTRKAARRAERRARRHLIRLGWRILARNLRGGRGEIDLLALDGGTLVVVEVRCRSHGILAADLSVDADKVRRIRRTWARIRSRHRLPRYLPVRGDLLLFGPSGPPAHVRGGLYLQGPWTL